MDLPSPEIHQSAQQVLQTWPGVARAFQVLGTACAGCTLARFCSLQDVAATYGIPPRALLEQLQRAIDETIPHQRSAP